MDTNTDTNTIAINADIERKSNIITGLVCIIAAIIIAAVLFSVVSTIQKQMQERKLREKPNLEKLQPSQRIVGEFLFLFCIPNTLYCLLRSSKFPISQIDKCH